MNDPCPICGKERGTVVGDFPRSYFCEGHKSYDPFQAQDTPMFHMSTGKNEERIVELLEKILEEIRTIKRNAKYK